VCGYRGRKEGSSMIPDTDFPWQPYTRNGSAIHSLRAFCVCQRAHMKRVTLDADMRKHVRAALYFEVKAA
jgi:hypothetical protein